MSSKHERFPPSPSHTLALPRPRPASPVPRPVLAWPRPALARPTPTLVSSNLAVKTSKREIYQILALMVFGAILSEPQQSFVTSQDQSLYAPTPFAYRGINEEGEGTGLLCRGGDSRCASPPLKHALWPDKGEAGGEIFPGAFHLRDTKVRMINS